MVCARLWCWSTFVFILYNVMVSFFFLWSAHKFTTITHLPIHHAHCLFFSWCRMGSPHCMWLPKGGTQTWWSSCWIAEGRSMPKPGWVFLFPEYDVVPSWEWIGIFCLLVLGVFCWVLVFFFKLDTGNTKIHSLGFSFSNCVFFSVLKMRH